jgi:hypothetical protein
MGIVSAVTSSISRLEQIVEKSLDLDYNQTSSSFVDPHIAGSSVAICQHESSIEDSRISLDVWSESFQDEHPEVSVGSINTAQRLEGKQPILFLTSKQAVSRNISS